MSFRPPRRRKNRKNWAIVAGLAFAGFLSMIGFFLYLQDYYHKAGIFH